MFSYNIYSKNELVTLVFIILIGGFLQTKTVTGEHDSFSKAVTKNNNDLPISHDSASVYENKIVKNEESNQRKLGWISLVLSEKLSNFRPKSSTNDLCNQQSDLYEKSLQNLTLWAVQMKEASATSTAGMMVGQRFQVGHYDECIAIQTPSVAGRYCLVNMKFAPDPELYPDFYTDELESVNPPPYSNAWDAFKKNKNPYLLMKNYILRGVCVPAACSRQDVEESLRNTFADVREKYGIVLNLTMDDDLCSSSIDEEPLPLSTRITIYGLVFLNVLTLLVSLYHLSMKDLNIDTRQGSLLRRILMSFSMENNFRSLTRGTGEKNMNILDGLKFYSMIQVVIGHRVIYIMVSMVFNPSFYEPHAKSDYLLFMPTLVVDTFFIVTGFLLFSVCYAPLKKQGMKIIPLLIFDRWLRLMPSLLALIIAIVYLLPYMGDGPMWHIFTASTAKACQKHWWATPLGLNNLIGWVPKAGKDVPCAPHTWYLACDLQLFPVGILIVYMFAKSHSAGFKFALAAFSVAIAIPFSIIYYNRYDGVFRFDPSHYPEGFSVDHLVNIYVQSYSRAGPYILSIMAAFLLMKIQEKKWTLSVSMRWFVLLFAIIIGQGSQYYALRFYDASREYNVFENALFGALHRSLWGIMICTIIVIQQAWGFGGNLDRCLTHPIYVPLSRLTYLVYLFHPFWQMITAANSRSPVYLSVWHIGWMCGGDIGVVFLGSLWLYFIIEGPTNKIRAALMSKITRGGQLMTSSKPQGSEKLD